MHKLSRDLNKVGQTIIATAALGPASTGFWKAGLVDVLLKMALLGDD